MEKRTGATTGRAVVPVGGLLRFVLVWAVGCGPDAMESRPYAEDGAVACERTADCSAAQVCRDGFCRIACRTAIECDAPVSVCDETLGFCVQCVDELDCGATEACVDGACTFFCAEDSDCDAWEYCDGSEGACVERDCATSADCRGGYLCERTGCVPTEPIVCEPMGVACSADRRAVLVCDEDGFAIESEEACDAREVCVDRGTTAACVPVVCVPLEIGCADGATARICDATGTVAREEACGDGRMCEAGVCRPQACAPSTTQCVGDSVVVCDAWGRVEERIECGQTPACASNPAGCVCAAGACLERVCVPGARGCDGRTAEVCDADGQAWRAAATCGTDEVCAAGACLPERCTPGRVECVGEILVACDTSGSERNETDCSVTGGVCQDRGCVPRVCEPSAVTCSADGRAVVRCDPRGAAQTVTPCASHQVCFEGGLCIDPPPFPAPEGVVASRGTSQTEVVVTWEPAAEATGYHVDRDGVRVTSTPTTETTFVDRDAPPGGVPRAIAVIDVSTDGTRGVTVWWSMGAEANGAVSTYQVRAVDGTRESALSRTAQGHRAGAPVTGHELQIDGGSWTSVGMEPYWVDTTAPAGTVTVPTPTATTTRTDRVDLVIGEATPRPGATRTYRARAISDLGPGAPSDEATGQRAVGPPRYQWEWASTSDGPYAPVPDGAARAATDSTIASGETRWYRVRVHADGAATAYSPVVAGRRGPI